MKFPRVTQVRVVDRLRLHITFSDGTAGEANLADLEDAPNLLGEVASAEMFPQVFVDEEAGTVAWPNGIDLDPLVLYADVTGKSIEELLDSLKASVPSQPKP